jgi:hypothetical protein
MYLMYIHKINMKDKYKGLICSTILFLSLCGLEWINVNLPCDSIFIHILLLTIALFVFGSTIVVIFFTLIDFITNQ